MNIGRLIISDPFARFLSDLFHLLPQASGVPMQIARWPIAPEGFKRCTMAGWWDIQTHLEEKIMAILQRILGSGWTMKHLGFQASLKKGTDFIVSCWRFLCWYHGAPNCSEERCEGQVPYKSWEATWRVINQTWWLSMTLFENARCMISWFRWIELNLGHSSTRPTLFHLLTLYLRRLRRCMLDMMDAVTIKEEMALVPGGDIRQSGNRWLRKAFESSNIKRVPREAEFRKLVNSVESIHKFWA